MQPDAMVVAYTRISTVNQFENGAGLETQRAKIIEYCKTERLKLIKIYEDVISGTTENREGLMSLMADCRQEKIDKVLVYRRDRIARDLFVCMLIERELKKHGIRIISVTEPSIDTSTPAGKFYSRVTDLMSEHEKNIITFRLVDGRQNAARQGKLASGCAPFGFYRDGKCLKVNETEGSWVRQIFYLAARGRSYSFIAKQLNDAGLKTRRGLPFQPESIKFISRNKIYIGEINYGNIIGVKAQHEPVVTKRIYMKVQRLRKKVQKTLDKTFLCDII